MLKNQSIECPTCEFSHNFKRTSWYTFEKHEIGHYITDDLNSTKRCKQQLVLGNFDYTFFCEVFDKIADEYHDKQ